MFKTEMHLHTAEVSLCARKHADEMIKSYKTAGYSTVCVTDHFQPNTLDSYGDISWEEKMTLFLGGYYRALRAGEGLGINVILGAEFKLPESVNHYLVYGLTKEFLVAHPDIHLLSLEEFAELIHGEGMMIVQAHPYRDGACFPTPEYIDAVEVCNTNPRHEDNGALTEALAKRTGLAVTGGSDAHRDEDVGLGGIESESEIKSAEELKELVLSKKIKVIGASR